MEHQEALNHFQTEAHPLNHEQILDRNLDHAHSSQLSEPSLADNLNAGLGEQLASRGSNLPNNVVATSPANEIAQTYKGSRKDSQ